MAKDNESTPFLDGLPLQPTEPPGFSHEQMVRCEECLRANPPTRVDCLYCGRGLPKTAAAVGFAKPSLRPLEQWEQGYNNVLLRSPQTEPAEELTNEIATFLRLEPSAIVRLLSAKCALPLARAATHEEAALIEQRLNALGLQTVIVPDQDLQIDASAPRRLRKLELREADLVAHQAGSREGPPIAWTEISLVLVGRLFVKQVELRERKSRKAESQILDTSEVMSDEAVVDFYTGNNEGSWRIAARGFDFSCLGTHKALLAGENFPVLISLLRERAPRAEYNDSYHSLRHCLDVVWPSEKRIESGGVRGRRLRYSTVEVITTNNEPQFTRYSRLCHYLKSHSLVQP